MKAKSDPAPLARLLEIMARLRDRESGCPWDQATCRAAAKAGHLEVLRWARENGCPCDKRTCANAAQGGHLGVLRWAFDHGCPCNDRTLAIARGRWPHERWARPPPAGSGPTECATRL